MFNLTGEGWWGRVAATGERRRVILMQYRPWGVRGDAWDDLWST